MFHEISWWDLEFDRTPVNFLSAAGVLQTKWVRVGMPKSPRAFWTAFSFATQRTMMRRLAEIPAGQGSLLRLAVHLHLDN